MFLSFAAAAGGGRWTPNKPVATHTALGQFTLGAGYDASNVYSVGTANRTGAVVALSSANSNVNITAKSPKGVTSSAALNVERRAITTTQTIVDSYEDFSGSCPAGYNREDYGVNGIFCRLYSVTEDSPPLNFIKAHGEWAKIT